LNYFDIFANDCGVGHGYSPEKDAAPNSAPAADSLTRQNCDSSDGPEHFNCEHRYQPGFQEWTMLGWVVTFLNIGFIAAVLGFGGIAGASFAAAKIVFFVAIILLLISIVFGAVGRSL
jgi:uncharacterized membrane protein YtjA (UPF0391 family)